MSSSWLLSEGTDFHFGESAVCGASSSATELLPSGFTFTPCCRGRCELGSGSYGRVFEVVDGSGEIFAAKCIVTSLAAQHQASLRRRLCLVSRELVLLGYFKSVEQIVRLRHAAVIRPSGSDTHVTWLIMEKMSCSLNQSLRQWWSLPFARFVMVHVLIGLAALHSANCVHRDLTPMNILLKYTADGDLEKACVADFGLSRYLDQMDSISFDVVTLTYRAPEIVMESLYGVASDMWSAGVILFELLTGGMRLFDVSNAQELLTSQMKCFGEPPDSLLQGAPAEVRGCVQRSVVESDAVRRHNFDIRIQSRTVESCEPMEQLQDARDLCWRLLQVNPVQRLSATEALKSPFFDDLRGDIDQLLLQNAEALASKRGALTKAGVEPSHDTTVESLLRNTAALCENECSPQLTPLLP